MQRFRTDLAVECEGPSFTGCLCVRQSLLCQKPCFTLRMRIVGRALGVHAVQPVSKVERISLRAVATWVTQSKAGFGLPVLFVRDFD